MLGDARAKYRLTRMFSRIISSSTNSAALFASGFSVNRRTRNTSPEMRFRASMYPYPVSARLGRIPSTTIFSPCRESNTPLQSFAKPRFIGNHVIGRNMPIRLLDFAAIAETPPAQSPAPYFFPPAQPAPAPFGNFGSCLVIAVRKSSLVMIQNFFGGASGNNRATVCWIMVCLPSSASNCFARLLAAQRPEARTTPSSQYHRIEIEFSATDSIDLSFD